MKDLKNYLQNFKTKLALKEKEDSILRNEINKIITELFPRHKNPLEFVRDFYVRSGILIIKTSNKSFANELFIRKNTILDQIKDNNRIKDLIIH